MGMGIYRKGGQAPKKEFLYGLLNNTRSKEKKQGKGIEGDMFEKVTNQNIR